jgi:hypothetical protein
MGLILGSVGGKRGRGRGGWRRRERVAEEGGGGVVDE